MLEYRFAQLTLASTLFLLFVGATVHPTGSSLACPEWLFVPTCNYELTPAMEGGVLYEHGHRLAAFLVGIFTVGLALLTWRRRRADRTSRILALVAVGGVMAQGGLGGLTVLLGLSPAVSIAHLALAMSFFSLMLVLAHRLRPASGRVDLPPPGPRVVDARRWAGVAFAAVLVQIILGGLVRHTGSAMMCLDLVLCGGQLWPAEPLAQVHMVHRFGAVLAAAIAYVAAFSAVGVGPGRTRLWGWVVALLVTAQVALGLLSVYTLIAIPVVVAHLVVGALLLAATLQLHLYLRDAAAGATPAGLQGDRPQAPARFEGAPAGLGELS